MAELKTLGPFYIPAPATVQKLMRYQTLTMTLRYAHLAPSHLHEAVERLSRECTGSVQSVPASASARTQTIQ